MGSCRQWHTSLSIKLDVPQSASRSRRALPVVSVSACGSLSSSPVASSCSRHPVHLIGTATKKIAVLLGSAATPGRPCSFAHTDPLRLHCKVPEPNLDAHVFAKFHEDIGSIQVSSECVYCGWGESDLHSHYRPLTLWLAIVVYNSLFSRAFPYS